MDIHICSSVPSGSFFLLCSFLRNNALFWVILLVILNKEATLDPFVAEFITVWKPNNAGTGVTRKRCYKTLKLPSEHGFLRRLGTTLSSSQKSQRAAANMAESEDEDSSLNLTGFLFGNINEKGELEDTEILDEVIYCTEWFTAVITLRKMGL